MFIVAAPPSVRQGGNFTQMKTEKAIQVLRHFSKWRWSDKDIEQPYPWVIGEAIDDVLMAIDEMKKEAELHRGAIKGWEDRWRCAVKLADRAKAERDDARADLEFRRDLFKLQEQQLNDVRNELNEERKEGEEQARLLGMGSEREAKLMAERDLWRSEAQRWRKQAIDLEGQIEAEIQRLQWRQHQLERGIKELKGDY
jgi:hypothetical protein